MPSFASTSTPRTLESNASARTLVPDPPVTAGRGRLSRRLITPQTGPWTSRELDPTGIEANSMQGRSLGRPGGPIGRQTPTQIPTDT
jgi:hypothetical protein